MFTCFCFARVAGRAFGGGIAPRFWIKRLNSAAIVSDAIKPPFVLARASCTRNGRGGAVVCWVGAAVDLHACVRIRHVESGRRVCFAKTCPRVTPLQKTDWAKGQQRFVTAHLLRCWMIATISVATRAMSDAVVKQSTPINIDITIDAEVSNDFFVVRVRTLHVPSKLVSRAALFARGPVLNLLVGAGDTDAVFSVTATGVVKQ